MTRASVSSDMYRRATVHSSLVSSMSAPTRRTMAWSFGKIPMTSARRLIVSVRSDRSAGAPAMSDSVHLAKWTLEGRDGEAAEAQEVER